METFKLQSYTKADLAQLYSPHSEGGAALQTLYRWMRRNEALMAELHAIGYNKFRHSFLKQEVEIIVKHFFYISSHTTISIPRYTMTIL